MLRRNTRAYRLTLFTLLLGVLGVGCFIAYRWQMKKTRDIDLQKASDAAYERGKLALEANDANTAMKAFYEAIQLGDKALDALEQEKKNAKNAGPTNVKDWDARRGRLLWIRSLALRDDAFANELSNGRPMEGIEDSVTRERFRFVGQIPAEDRRLQAIACLREAGRVLTNDRLVQRELIRLEMLSEPLDWNHIERISRNLIALDPEDVRARYLLARLELDQTRESGLSVQLNKLPRSRVDAAYEHLRVVKAAPDYHPWRTLYLEAKVAEWRMKESPNNSQEKTENRERLRSLLLDPEMGVLGRTSKKEAFTSLGRWDIEGLINLHQMAIELVIDEMRATKGVRSKNLFAALNSMCDLASDLSTSPLGKPYQGYLLEAAIGAATAARKMLGKESPAKWIDIRDRLEKLTLLASEAQVSWPVAYAAMAQLLNNDAYLLGRQDHSDAKRDLETRALFLVDAGLNAAISVKEPAAKLIDLYGAGIEILVSRNAEAKDFRPYAQPLKQIADARASAIIDLHEAAMNVRQGKLSKAWMQLEKVLKNPRAADMRPRALALLANVALNTQQPTQASAALRELETALARLDELTPADGAWMREFLGDSRDIAVQSVLAELETAVSKIAHFRQENPGSAVPDSVTLPHENSARRSLAALRIGSEANRQARVIFVNYYARLGEIGKASDTLNLLKIDYPASQHVLRLDVALTTLPDRSAPDTPEAMGLRRINADAKIQAFIEANPNDLSAKRFWAEWLIRSNRSEEAAIYLKDRNRFPDDEDQANKRMLAVALFERGDRDEGLRLLQQLPKDQSIEAFLIRTSSNPEVRDQLLEEAISKYENNGLFRVWAAEKLMAEGKNAEAAYLFRDAMEFTRLKRSAQLGFLRSMLTLARGNPDQALQIVDQYSQETPDDGLLYSIGAYAALQKDDIGALQDRWSKSKSMCAALNQWQAAANKGGLDSLSIFQFRSQFWLQANRPDQAWAELATLTGSRLHGDAVLAQMIDLAIAGSDDQKLTQASQFLNRLKSSRKNSNEVQLLEARLLLRMGNSNQAITVLEGLLESQPTYLNAYPLLVQILNEQKLSERATLWTSRWSERAPLDPVAILERIRQNLVAGQTAKAQEDAEVFVIDAANRLEKRFTKYTNPEIDKLKRERLNVVRSAACLALAQTWMQAGNLEGAEEFLRRCLKLDASSVPALLLSAQIAITRKEWPKAHHYYEEALKLQKDNVVAVLNQAWLLAVHLDQPADALKLIRGGMMTPNGDKSVAVERLTPEFLDILGQVYLRAAQRKVEDNLLDEMVRIFETATQRYPSDPRCFVHLGEAYDGLSEPANATNAYQIALKLAQDGKGRFSPEERNELVQKISSRPKSR